MAMTTLQTATYAIAGFMNHVDVWLTPTLGAPPLRIGEMDQSADWTDLRNQLAMYVPFTPIANFAGLPAMSVPLDWSTDDLPLGSHFIARIGQEGMLLRLAAQLEAAHPWAHRRPPVHAAGR